MGDSFLCDCPDFLLVAQAWPSWRLACPAPQQTANSACSGDGAHFIAFLGFLGFSSFVCSGDDEKKIPVENFSSWRCCEKCRKIIGIQNKLRENLNLLCNSAPSDSLCSPNLCFDSLQLFSPSDLQAFQAGGPSKAQANKKFFEKHEIPEKIAQQRIEAPNLSWDVDVSPLGNLLSGGSSSSSLHSGVFDAAALAPLLSGSEKLEPLRVLNQAFKRMGEEKEGKQYPGVE